MNTLAKVSGYCAILLSSGLALVLVISGLFVVIALSEAPGNNSGEGFTAYFLCAVFIAGAVLFFLLGRKASRMLLLAGTYGVAASGLTLPRLLAADFVGALASLAGFITGLVGGWAVYLEEASDTDFHMDEFVGPIIGGLLVALVFAWASVHLLAVRRSVPS